MGVKVTDGKLEFTSKLDTEGFKAGTRDFIKSIRGLSDELKLLEQQKKKTFNEADLISYNKRIQEVQTQISQMSNVGKKGFDEFGNKINQTTGFTGKFTSAIASLGTALLGAFTVQRLISFGRELFEIEKKADGIERAFARLGQSELLDNLRKQTQGFISDLDLEKLAVKANNFNIPLDKLGTLLLFASQRAKDTGVSVEKLTEDIISGLGRKSTRIIDNLGISAIEVQKEFKKTGDFTVAVTNIIQKQMGIAGEAVDTLADRTNRLGTFFENVKKKLANLLFDDGTLANNNIITKLTESGLKAVGDFTKKTDEERAAQLIKQADVIKKLSDQYKTLKAPVTQAEVQQFQGDKSGFAKFTANRSAQIKATSEQLVAAQNVFNTIKKQNDELTTQERIKKNIVSIDELQQRVTDLRSEASGIIINDKSDEARVRSLNKQADEVQKRIDDLNGKSEKKSNADVDREKRAAEQIFKANQSLQERIKELKDKYAAKAISSDEAQVEALRTVFKKLAFDISTQNTLYDNFAKKYGKAAAKRLIGDKIDPKQLDKTRDDAITDLVLQQSLEKEKINIRQQKDMFLEFEAYKIKVGTDAANKRFSSELGGFKTYVDYLKSLLPNVNDKGTDANKLREFLNEEIITAQGEEETATEKHLTQLLIINETYQQKRQALIEVANDEIRKLNEKGYTDQAIQVKVNLENDLTSLDEANVKTKVAYKELFDGLQVISESASRKNIEALRRYLSSALKAGEITKEAYLVFTKQLNDLTNALDQKAGDKLISIGNGLQAIAQNLTGVNEGLGSMVSSLGKLANNVGSIQKMGVALKNARTDEEKFNAEASLAVAGISGVVQVVDTLINAAAQRKAAEKAYYDAVLSSQNQMNLSLNEEIRLRAQLNNNVFFKNYKADIISASLALDDANKKFAQSLIALQGGQAKTGTKNVVDGKSVANSALGGAAAGAVIGSVVPVIGTVAGAIVGGLAGAISGLFGGKKKVDTLGSLLGIYPELITKDKNGIEGLNASLAKNLIQNNLVSDSTKVLLQNTIDLNDARQAAIDQINSDIKDLAGSLGDDLRNSLVKAFEDGTDAAIAFGDSVSKVIENIVSQFLFQDIFGSEFDKLQANLKGSFGIKGDQNATDDLTKFFKDALPLVKVYQDALKQAQQAAGANGINIFQPSGSSGGQNSLQGSIRASLTEATGEILAGTLKGIQQGVYETVLTLKGNNLTFGQMLMIAQQALTVAIQIEANTKRSADNSDALPIMLGELKGINSNTKGTLDIDLRAAGFYKY